MQKFVKEYKNKQIELTQLQDLFQSVCHVILMYLSSTTYQQNTDCFFVSKLNADQRLYRKKKVLNSRSNLYVIFLESILLWLLPMLPPKTYPCLLLPWLRNTSCISLESSSLVSDASPKRYAILGVDEQT